MQIYSSVCLLIAGLIAGLFAGRIASTEPLSTEPLPTEQVQTEKVETGRLDDQSLQFAIKAYGSVEQVYFPNLNQVVGTLNLIIQNASLPGECKRSLIQLSSGMSSRETWALSCK